MGPKSNRSLTIAVGVLAALLLLNAGLCYRNTWELNERAGWVSHTLEVEETLADLKATVTDAESGVRAYVVTGDDSFLAAYRNALRAVEGKIDRLARLTGDNPAQHGRVPHLRQLAQERMEELAKAQGLREKQGFDAARKVMLDGGRAAMDAFLGLVTEMAEEEKGLLRDRQTRTDQAYLTAVVSGLLAAFLGLVAAGAVVWLGRRSLSATLRAAALLRQERERLRVSLTSIGDAVIATDTEGRVTFLNPTAQALTGWAEAEAQGRPLAEVFPILNEQTRRPVESPVARVLREGVVVGLANHTVLVARDGTERPIEDSAAPIKEDDGSIVGVILVFHDVTERRKADRLVRESEARYRSLFESMDEGYCVIEVLFDGDDSPLDYRFLRVNPAFEKQTGIRDAEGRLMREIAPDHEQHWFDIYGRIALTGETTRFENPAAALGRYYDVCAFRVGPPELRHVGIVFNDITERKQMTDALRRAEEEFRTSFELAAVGKVQIDPATRRFVRVNRKFCDITGYAHEELLGLTPDDLTHPDDREDDRRRLGRMLRGEDAVYSNDKRYVRKDGRPVWVNVTATLVRDGEGRPVRTIGVVQDLTERKRLDEELRQRVADLAEADRRKDRFVMMLAHELRNPLAPLRNGLHLLQAIGHDGQLVEQARTIMARQVGHMARIVEDLLDVSRLMRGRVELRPERLDLGRVAQTVAGDQLPAFDRAGLTLETDLPELPVWVNADPTRLTQVLDNLLQNAGKFTEAGGTVSVQVRPDAGRGQAVLTVRDTGVGIEPGLLPHLFETFTQADRSLDRSKGGLGLGLSLVKGLVELHGGTVEARSEGPGRGAEFVVRLPLQPEPAAVSSMPAAAKRASKRLRVLVVEDNRDAADSLKMLLELFGYEVAVAYTGPAGVEAAKACVPDVVLCDIGLPGLSGYEVARELRREPATANARIIAVTGYGGEEDRLKAREAGFDAHLVKPADPSAIQELLAVPG